MLELSFDHFNLPVLDQKAKLSKPDAVKILNKVTDALL